MRFGYGLLANEEHPDYRGFPDRNSLSGRSLLIFNRTKSLESMQIKLKTRGWGNSIPLVDNDRRPGIFLRYL
jgi:hypothetical protein